MKSSSRETRGRGVLFTAISVLVVIVFGVWYFIGHLGDFKKILEIDFISFLALSLLCILAIWVSGLSIQAILRVFDTRITPWEAFGLSALNTMANFYLTKAGTAAKGVYLKKRHQFPYAHFLSTTAGSFVVTLLTQGLMGIVFSLFFFRVGGVRIEFLIAFTGLSIAGLLPFVVPSVSLKGNHALIARIQRVIDGWSRIKRRYAILCLLVLLNAIYVVLGAARLYISYHALDYPIRFLTCLVISPLSTLTVVLSITPGAVGIRQALVGYSSKLLDSGLTEGVVASTIDHAVGTLWVFVFGMIFTNWVWAARSKSRGAAESERPL